VELHQSIISGTSNGRRVGACIVAAVQAGVLPLYKRDIAGIVLKDEDDLPVTIPYEFGSQLVQSVMEVYVASKLSDQLEAKTLGFGEFKSIVTTGARYAAADLGLKEWAPPSAEATVSLNFSRSNKEIFLKVRAKAGVDRTLELTADFAKEQGFALVPIRKEAAKVDGELVAA
jgi:hypothetical protein